MPAKVGWNLSWTGRLSFMCLWVRLVLKSDKLMDNLTAVVEAVMKAKPSGAKGQYIKTASLTTTMGPGIKLDLKPTLSLTSG